MGLESTLQLDRAQVVDQQFINCVQHQKFPQAHTLTQPEEAGLNQKAYLDLFHSQCVSRHLDLQARILKEQNKGFYTIGSSGHEGNAAIARAFEVKDMAFLHYRSGAFVIQRAKQAGMDDPIYDQCLSLVASSQDPISGGRHKVFGSKELNIPPQTSTIASHLPKAVGTALALTLAKSMKIPKTALAPDSVVLCSFGDGSFNHASTQTALHSASWAMDHHVHLPLVFLCEDNGISISVPTPEHWIGQCVQNRPHWQLLTCDGRNLADTYQTAMEANRLARKLKIPVFIHMKTTRLLGHAGSDIEFHYRKLETIEHFEKDDPLLHSARTLIEHDWMSSQGILDLYELIRKEVKNKADKAVKQPKLTSKEAIMQSIIPPKRKTAPPSEQESMREKIFGEAYQRLKVPKNLAQNINSALTDLFIAYPQACLFGEDVGKKGGVYQVTRELQKQFGQSRVFDTLLDEQTILGNAIGLAHHGLLPVPEIQFLAYLHNAVDQIRGEASTLSFFSNGQFTNPMVLRLPSLGYQKGFGGHFHNDNALAFLREIPGIILACPSKAADGALLLRECFRLAHEEQRVVIFLEPIALYMTRDLYDEGDKKALEPYPELDQKLPFGEVGVEGSGSDLTLISYGNGAHLSRIARKRLEQEGVKTQLIDLRWLHPLPENSLKQALEGTTKVLIVDECRRTGSLSEGIITWMLEQGLQGIQVKRLTAEDSFIPIGQAWQYVLPSVDSIVESAHVLLKIRAKAS